MPRPTARRRKPEFSAHQKQIRFITRLAVLLCSSLTFAFFWLVSRTSSITH